jgi:hypothetical protein
MSKRKKTNQPKSNYPIGKAGKDKQEAKKEDFYHKHKSTFWTILVLIILLYFFIVNNTRYVPEEGPLPPNYNQQNSAEETK